MLGNISLTETLESLRLKDLGVSTASTKTVIEKAFETETRFETKLRFPRTLSFIAQLLIFPDFRLIVFSVLLQLFDQIRKL